MNRNLSPLVSVIVPCFNAEKWVGNAIDSVLSQTYENIEIIVVNDGSTDNSRKVIERYTPRVRTIEQSNKGGNAARNAGFVLSKGDYIQFLDADDILAPNKIEEQVDKLTGSDADVAYGDWSKLFDRCGVTSLGEIETGEIGHDPLASLLFEFWHPPFCYLFKRRIVESRPWDEDVAIIQDVNYLLQVAILGATFCYVPGLNGHYRKHHATTVSTRSARAFKDGVLANTDMILLFCRDNNGLTPERRRALLSSYGALLRYYFEHDKDVFGAILNTVRGLDGEFIPREPRRLRFFSIALGYPRAEGIALNYRRVKRAFGLAKPEH